MADGYHGLTKPILLSGSVTYHFGVPWFYPSYGYYHHHHHHYHNNDNNGQNTTAQQQAVTQQSAPVLYNYERHTKEDDSDDDSSEMILDNPYLIVGVDNMVLYGQMKMGQHIATYIEQESDAGNPYPLLPLRSRAKVTTTTIDPIVKEAIATIPELTIQNSTTESANYLNNSENASKTR